MTHSSVFRIEEGHRENCMETTQTAGKKLCKSRQNRIIDGICGGIGEYFEVDPTIVRILWVFLTLLGGSGLILYIVAMIIMPVNTEPLPADAAKANVRFPDRRSYWGIVLILIGMFVLLERTQILSGFSWWGVSRTFVFPVSLIVIGLMFIYAHTRRTTVPAGAEGTREPGQPGKELRRSPTEKKVCGVCGGIAAYFGYDPTLVRILFIFLVFASFGWGLLLYVILCLLMPEDKIEPVSAPGGPG
jgi:phage shock protein C